MAKYTAPTHIAATRALGASLAETAPRQITAIAVGGATVTMGFANQANADAWISQNAWRLDEITANRG